MIDYANITHPLLSDPGTCQSERSLAQLNPASVRIEQQSLEDILQFVTKYGRFVNFYEAEKIGDSRFQENYTFKIGNWQDFFRKSIPFQLAAISKTDIAELESNLARLLELVTDNTNGANFQLLVNFIFNELIAVFEDSLNNVAAAESPFSIVIQRTMSAALRAPLGNFITDTLILSKHTLADFKGIDFSGRMVLKNWDIPSLDGYLVAANEADLAMHPTTSLKNAFSRNANIFIKELRGLAQKSSHFLPTALYPNKEAEQGKIVPHIGLLIAFLELQKKFTAELNDLTRRHLLFFYNDVLQIKEKPLRADETYVVFQLQKQVTESYLLRKGTQVKDGKDANKADILFGLEKDVVLDRAEITEMRTLFLNRVEGFAISEKDTPSDCPDGKLKKFVEGLYIAPKANSQDGVEEDFKVVPKNWATLGAKESKFLQENNSLKEHPEARVGFVLSSSVLLLNEGKRKIEITLNCRDENQGGGSGKTASQLFNTDKGKTISNIEELIKLKKEDNVTDELFFRFISLFWTFDSLILNTEEILVEATETEEEKHFFTEEEKTKIKNYFKSLEEGEEEEDDGQPEEEEEDIAEFDYVIINLMALKEQGAIPLDKAQTLLERFKFKNQVSTEFLETLKGDFKDLVLEYLYIRPFNIYLSGKEEWLKVINKDIIITLNPIGVAGNNDESANLLLKIELTLQDDFPAVTFSDPEKLGVEVTSNQPSVRIEIDPKYKEFCDSKLYMPCCSLSHCQEEETLELSPYEFLRDLTIIDSCIDVEVCGVKNLIVQNDESVQAVNSLIYPFDTRPRFEKNLAAPYTAQGSNFYIGSQEVFCKNWKNVLVNINWKDKPFSFCDHYIGYEDATKGIGQITGDDFKVRIAILEDGKWKDFYSSFNNKQRNNFLFNEDEKTNRIRNFPYELPNKSRFSHQRIFDFQREQQPDFLNTEYRKKELIPNQTSFTQATRDGFLRFTLSNLDFQHKQYPFILARQMMAFGKLEADGKSVYVPGAVYYSGDLKNNTPTNTIFNNVKNKIRSIGQIFNQVIVFCKFIEVLDPKLSKVTSAILNNPNNLNQLRNNLQALVNGFDDPNDPNDLASQIVGRVNAIFGGISSALPLTNLLIACVNKSKGFPVNLNSNTDDPPLDNLNKQNIYFGNSYLGDAGINQIMTKLKEFLAEIKSKNDVEEDLGVVIPNEPWTPIIKEISIDYTAKAEQTDIELTHLYPFENTYKKEDLNDDTKRPSLFPIFEDEGTLFIGLDKLTKGNTLNLLFQLAEATANSEMEKAIINWAYLSGNKWKTLGTGTKILNDDTNGLTKSGIIEISIPKDINKEGNTIMPPDSYWIKAAAKENSRAVCETIAIYTQAAKAKATFTERNDPKRLALPLPAEQINRLAKADTSIKKVLQPMASINGRPPEGDAPTALFRRISERLRHKGRAINGFDYERIILENFPQVFKTKTINHAFGLPGSNYVKDLEVVAPGFVLIGVIPDIQQLDTGNSPVPRLPISQLEQIKALLKQKTSPFIRLKIMNPRYEKVNVEVTVKFQEGNGGDFYKGLLEKDIKNFLAPWTLGKMDRLNFGEKLSKSDLIYFIERLYYVDFICDLKWVHEFDLGTNCEVNPLGEIEFITPMTARSILTTGKINAIELERSCEEYDNNHKCEEGKELPPEEELEEETPPIIIQ